MSEEREICQEHCNGGAYYEDADCYVCNAFSSIKALEQQLADALAEPSEAMAVAGYEKLESRGFKLLSSDLDVADLIAVYRAMQTAREHTIKDG